MSITSSQRDATGTAASSRLTLAMAADRLDAAVLLISRAAAGLFLLLTAAILVHVVLRYAAGINLVWLEELHWQLYAFLATLGVASAAATNSHVRLDLLHPRFSRRTKAFIEVVGQGLFVLPLTVLIGWHGWLSVAQAFAINERSVNEQGLPFTFIVKAALPLACGLIGLTAVARLLRAVPLLGQPQLVDPVRRTDWNRYRSLAMILGLTGVAAVFTAAGAIGRIEPSYALVVLMFASFMAVLFSGFPIAFVLGGIAVVFIGVGYAADYVGYTLSAAHPGTKLYLGTAAGFVNRIYGGLLTKPELVALPMFIFMGLLLDRSGMDDAGDAAALWPGPWWAGDQRGADWNPARSQYRHHRGLGGAAGPDQPAGHARPGLCPAPGCRHRLCGRHARDPHAAKHHAGDHGRSSLGASR